MKLKEYFYALGLKPNIKLCPASLGKVTTDDDLDLDFYHWEEPGVKQLSIDQTEINELKKFISPGDIAIDIGAFTGDSTLPIALACGQEGKVYAFEPNPITFQVLAKNSLLNKNKTNIIPIPFACTKESSSNYFGYSNQYLCNGGNRENLKHLNGHFFSVPVNGANPISIISSFSPNDLAKVKYIKIDTEGHDYDVLNILKELIDAQSPFIKFEIAKKTSIGKRSNIQDFFRNRNYDLTIVSSTGQLFTNQPVKASDYFRNETIDIFCTPKKITK